MPLVLRTETCSTAQLRSTMALDVNIFTYIICVASFTIDWHAATKKMGGNVGKQVLDSSII